MKRLNELMLEALQRRDRAAKWQPEQTEQQICDLTIAVDNLAAVMQAVGVYADGMTAVVRGLLREQKTGGPDTPVGTETLRLMTAFLEDHQEVTETCSGISRLVQTHMALQAGIDPNDGAALLEWMQRQATAKKIEMN